MRVKLVTPEQARTLYKRFDNHYTIRPMPTKNDMFYIDLNTLKGLDDFLADNWDKINSRPNLRNKIIEFRDFMRGLTTYETDDFPQHMYTTEEQLVQGGEYALRAEYLEFENIT